MKILAIGGGSMGRRRLRDLTHLARGEVVLLEPNAERCRQVSEAFGVRGVTDPDQAWAEKPDVVTISTPPALHEDYVRRAVRDKLHVFAEVPFVMDEGLLAEVAVQAKTYPAVLGISASTKYYPPFRLVRDLLAQGRVGKPLYFEYSLGNYLPEWHPYEDYRTFYGSSAKLGGAGFDMLLHEMNTIQWWLGEVASLQARMSKLSNLEIQGPDSQDILLTFASGCQGYFHNDVIEQHTQGRHLRIVGDGGTIEWHQNLSTVRLYDGSAKETRELEFSQAGDWDEAVRVSREVTELIARQKARSGHIPGNEAAPEFSYESCYLRELRYFMDAVAGKHPYTIATPAGELSSVRVFHTMLRSSEQGRELKVGQA